MRIAIVVLFVAVVILSVALERTIEKSAGYMLREEVAVVALKLHFGVDYEPPPATGKVFADMTNVDYFGTKWAEAAYNEGLFRGCGWEDEKPLFCPGGGN